MALKSNSVIKKGGMYYNQPPTFDNKCLGFAWKNTVSIMRTYMLSVMYCLTTEKCQAITLP